MEYNTTLFGNKRTVYHFANNVYTRLFEIGSQNISVQQGFDSGAFEKQSQLPADIALWEIGEESVLTRLTWRKKVDNQRIVHHSNDDKDRVKLMLSTNGAKVNTTTFDVTSGSGSVYDRTAQCNYRNLVTQSNFNPIQQFPLWNPVAGVLSTAPHFSTQPFIFDFDYSGVLLGVYVATGSTTMSLKQFLDNNNTGTRITALYVEPTFGTATNHLSPTNTRFENESNQIYLQGINLINSKMYDLPFDVRADLGIFVPSFIMASRPVTQFNPNNYLWVIIDVPTTTTSYRVSYYQDENRIDELGIIPHGENGEYNQNDIDWMLKQIAFLGFWFTTDSTNIQSRVTGENCTDINTYLPEIKDGITTGKYWSGTTAAQQDAAKWADNWREKVNYQPGGGSGDENKDRGDLTTTRRNGTLPTNTKNYSISANDFNALCTWCNNGFQVTDNNQFLEDFKGLNPSECIISAMYFPFALLGAVSVTQIKIGNLTAENIGADKIEMHVNYGSSGAPTTTSAPIKYILNNGLPIAREFDDFRDYAPYTTIDMYIPFCGSISLNPADIYDYPLTVEIIPDLLTGSCVGCVYRGDYLLTTVDGQIGVPITLTLGQVGDYQNAITQAAFNLKNANRQMFSSWLGAVASVGAIASGNVLAGTAGLIGSGLSIINSQDNIKKAEYDLSHIPRNFNTVGSLSDSINVLTMPEYVHMIIKRPYNLQGADISQYAHTVGHACNRQGYVSDFSGYTLASDIDLSGISATAEELEQIRKYFATGVYL